jgi:putative nucleotidyltransferase with HDIG domain
MVIAQELHDAGGTMLLADHARLTTDNIAYLTYIGSPGVYIDDEVSRNIQVTPVVQEEVRQGAVSLIQNVFSKVSDDEGLGTEERLIRLMAESVVNDVMVQEDVVYNMVDIKTYDDYVYFHSMNVGVLAAVIGANMNLDEDAMDDLVTAAFLHDIGKVFISRDLLNAGRRLTPEESQQMKQHPQVGYDYLKREFHFPDSVNEAVYQHHEWFNGKGYPQKLKGENIQLIARILHAVDVYDEMVTKRPHHAAYLPSDAIEYIMGRTGSEFDPAVVKVMSSQLALYPVGSEVVLSDERHAIVVENHAGFMQRPTVRVVDTEEEINLLSDRDAYNITIVRY